MARMRVRLDIEDAWVLTEAARDYAERLQEYQDAGLPESQWEAEELHERQARLDEAIADTLRVLNGEDE